MVEVAGKILEQSNSILIEPVSTHSYISPRVVEIFSFKKVRHRKSWLVQLATGTKRKVSEVVEKFPLVMNGLVTCVDLNVLVTWFLLCSHLNGLVIISQGKAQIL